MQDNRWLYFIVGGLLVVALVFFGLFYDRDGAPTGAGSTQVESTAQPAGSPPAASPPAGAAAGSASGGGSSTSITVEQKKD